MPEAEIPNVTAPAPDKDLEKPEALEVWKHFAATGAADKSTMVTVASWLLAFSGAIGAYIVTEMFQPDRFAFVHPRMAFCLAVLGLVVSASDAYVVFMYGGYANRNWAMADKIAGSHGLGMLVPDFTKDSYATYGLPLVTKSFSSHRDPNRKLAPVFWFFAGLALGGGIVHLIFLAESVREIVARYCMRGVSP